jgi:hypothetical protein
VWGAGCSVVIELSLKERIDGVVKRKRGSRGPRAIVRDVVVEAAWAFEIEIKF